jgi:hypothetical protein
MELYPIAIVVICIFYLTCIAVLKFKYRFWYNQPITFRFWPALWYNSEIKYPLSRFPSIGVGGAVVYPFINNVNYTNICVYYSLERFHGADKGRANDIQSIPFDEIAKLLNIHDKCSIGRGNGMLPFVHSERLAQTVNNYTHGLSAFVGVFYRPTFIQQTSSRIINETDEIQGVSILTPRIKIDISRDFTKPSTTIYVCEHLAWNDAFINDRQSLELLDTTEYIQKSREISAEQTLYRYTNIPWFVVPFSTVYTYVISLDTIIEAPKLSTTVGIVLVKVSSVNFDLFYNFIIEYSRDFRCSIINNISHIQHLVETELYNIYILIWNKTHVISAYVYGPSWMRMYNPTDINIHMQSSRRDRSSKRRSNNVIPSQRMRIDKLREHIADTSTALIKHLPPADTPQYDISGKRINRTNGREDGGYGDGNRSKYQYSVENEIPCLISSIQNKHHCNLQTFIYGFIESLRDLKASHSIHKKQACNILIDTIAHNYRILDEINRYSVPITIKKWYYVMYNANIQQELSCKDLFMI